MPPASDGGEVRVVVAHVGAIVPQQLDDFQRGRFAQVVNVSLVGDAEYQHLRAIDRLLRAVQRRAYRTNNVIRHRRVHLAQKLDEARVKVELLRFPGEIKRIDRDAMSAKSRAGIKRMEPKRLCRSRLDDFPNIDAHAQTKLLQLVDHRYVHTTVDVL